MTVSGDFMAEDGGKLVVNIEKISTDVIMNIRFVTVDGEFVAGGDYFIPFCRHHHFCGRSVPERKRRLCWVRRGRGGEASTV